ncbi:MAG: HAD family phosphatase [Coriobacteriia bacterium]|nr:HAD family phosphatase [Coriobacteriia bacterium]
MAIKNIVFDIGGVLADYNVNGFLSAKGFDATMIKRILKASVMTPYWEMFERGAITEEEALQGFASADPEIEHELRVAFSSVEGMLTAKDFAIPLVKSLKAAGFRVYYLSNYSQKAYNECGESLAFMPYMDGGIVSFRVGKTKPDPAMYRQFLEEYQLDAGECVFVDDTPANVEAARALGFAGVDFVSYDDLIARLAELGVELAK